MTSQHVIITDSLAARFLTLLQAHVTSLRIEGEKATGICPLHADHHPSFHADLKRGLWFCFPCGVGGGVKRFAELMGEPLLSTYRSSRQQTQFVAQTRRRQAHEQALRVLRQRQEKRLDEVFDAWRAAHRDAATSATLLGLFFRNLDLEREFPEVVAWAEREYSNAVSRRDFLQAHLAGEVARWQAI